MCRNFAAAEAMAKQLSSAPRKVRVCVDFLACPSLNATVILTKCALACVLCCLFARLYGAFVQRGRRGDAQQVRKEGKGQHKTIWQQKQQRNQVLWCCSKHRQVRPLASSADYL